MNVKHLLLPAVGLAAASLFGGTWYVDASRPDDAGDGRSLATAKKYIQSAVSLAEASGDEKLAVLVAPGTYDSGETVDSYGATNRVVIKKAMTLKATGSRDDTFIVGALSANGAYGLGTDSVRCVCVDGASTAGTVISGFTFRNGAAGSANAEPAGAGGGVCFNGTGSVYVKDCTVTNCAAYYGGGLYGVVAIRSLIVGCHNNKTEKRGAALCACKAYNCILIGNGQTDDYKEYILWGDGPYVNCTAVANNGSLLRYSASQLMYNTLSVLATRQEFDNTNTGGGNNVVSYSNGVSKQSNSKQIKTDTDLFGVMVAPLLGDCRPCAGGLADGTGDVSYCTPDWVPEEDRNLDFAGNPRTTGGKVDVGALQGAVTLLGGCLAFPPERVKTTSTAYYMRTSFVNAVNWPLQVRFTPSTNAFCTKIVEGNAVVPRFADAAGGFWQTLPPFGKTARCEEIAATATLAVGPGAAYATIQAAVDAAGDAANAFTIIDVSPGTYATGSATLTPTGDANEACVCRVAVVDKNVFVRATGAVAETVICGAKDDSAASGYGGCGANAVRCVGVTASDRFVAFRGFTLTGGATRAHADDASCDGCPANAGGGLYVFASKGAYGVQLLDSTLTGCSGWDGAAVRGGWLQGCLVHENDGPAKSGLANVPGATVRGAVLSQCVVQENSIGGNQILSDGTTCCLSSVFGTRAGQRQALVSSSSRLYGSIVCEGVLDKAAVTKESIFWDQTGTGGPTTGFVVSDPKLADPAHGNFAPTAGSPAVGGANAAEIPDFWIVATADFLQSPLNVTASRKVTIGAVQNAYVPKTIYVDAAQADDSGDGLSPATAKKTLAGVAALAICGDTIEAAPGDYDDGTMAQTEAVIRGNYSKVVSRAILPSGVSLVSREGAASTRIVGSTNVNAWVRGLVMADGASVRGFTFVTCGAYSTKNSFTDANVVDENVGGAILASTNVGCRVSVENCVFVGSRASFGGAGFARATYRRCVFEGNVNQGTSDKTGGVVYCGTFENCLFRANQSSWTLLGSYGGLKNCSLVGNAIGKASSTAFIVSESDAEVCNTIIVESLGGVNAIASAHNVFLPRIKGMSGEWMVAAGGETCITNVTLETNDPGLADAGAWTNSTYTVDCGDNAFVAVGADLAGVPRVLNGTVDLGCYERDVRGDMSAHLSRHGDVTVTAVSADVISVDGGVRLSDGSTLSLDWASRGLDPLIGYRIQLDLNGTGMLTVRNGDQIVATLTTSGRHVLDPRGADPLHLTFAFAGAGATATLSRFSRDRGSVIICR